MPPSKNRAVPMSSRRRHWQYRPCCSHGHRRAGPAANSTEGSDQRTRRAIKPDTMQLTATTACCHEPPLRKNYQNAKLNRSNSGLEARPQKTAASRRVRSAHPRRRVCARLCVADIWVRSVVPGGLHSTLVLRLEGRHVPRDQSWRLREPGIAPGERTCLEARVDPAGGRIREIHDRQRPRALTKELGITIRRHGVAARIDLAGRPRSNVDLGIAINIDEHTDIENVHLAVPAKCNCARHRSFGNAVVQETRSAPACRPSWPR